MKRSPSEVVQGLGACVAKGLAKRSRAASCSSAMGASRKNGDWFVVRAWISSQAAALPALAASVEEVLSVST